MPHQAGVPTQALDELRQTLATELAALVDLADRVLAEMTAIDDLRMAMTDNGARLLAARHARRSAIRTRTTASESTQRAIDNRQRACDLASELDSVSFRTRTLLDGRHHRAAPSSPRADGAVAA